MRESRKGRRRGKEDGWRRKKKGRMLRKRGYEEEELEGMKRTRGVGGGRCGGVEGEGEDVMKLG